MYYMILRFIIYSFIKLTIITPLPQTSRHLGGRRAYEPYFHGRDIQSYISHLGKTQYFAHNESHYASLSLALTSFGRSSSIATFRIQNALNLWRSCHAFISCYAKWACIASLSANFFSSLCLSVCCSFSQNICFCLKASLTRTLLPSLIRLITRSFCKLKSIIFNTLKSQIHLFSLTNIHSARQPLGHRSGTFVGQGGSQIRFAEARKDVIYYYI